LVELQLTHSAGIKSLIDHAWGVGHVKQKKKEPADVPIPDPSDPFSRENLSFGPVGQDSSRMRYWVVDGVYTPLSTIPVIFACICADPIYSVCCLSFPMLRRSPSGILSQITMSRLPMLLIRSDSPRVYVSTNPWKVTSTFQTVSSTREEYVALIGKLKASAPTKPKSKVEFAHWNLVLALEGRLEAIDKELTVSLLHGVLNEIFFLSLSLCRISSRRLCYSHLFFSGYSGHAERLSSAISSSRKLKSGKREHGDRLTGLITFTTMPKVATYVFGFQLRLGCR
jgi:hypothetical protein